MIRGNEKKNIFHDEEDKLRFLETLMEQSKKRQYAIYAYCLMDNHVHLLLNEGNDEISRIMKSVNISYVYYFNKKYGRVGHLFQDRFKSEAIDTDEYLMSAVRYIHNNPIKAGLVKRASQYKWSSYKLYVQPLGQNIVDTELVLGLFSNHLDNAIAFFEEFSDVQNAEQFIDVSDKVIEKQIQTEEEAREWLKVYLGKEYAFVEIKDNINLRKDIILELKNKSSLTIQQIANLLGLGRNIIQRTK
jgi:REP element-mobilizing transposase RayT